MNSSTFWNSYLKNCNTDKTLQEGFFLCEQAFSDHKEIISRLVNTLSPNTIAILGSGYLNDIPLGDLVENNRKLYLVDWIDNISKVGVSKSIVCKDEIDGHNCLFCVKNTAKQYCNNFTGEFLEKSVCTGFEPVDEPFITCKNYEPASEPSFIKADITGGISRDFASKIRSNITSCKTPKNAFLKALSLSDKLKHEPMPVEDNSIELVTSSMVLSQFDVEPYGYFSTLLEKQYGCDEIAKQESKLMPLMERLRTKLFILQVESHIKEMYRIVKKDKKSRIYVSAELFRSYPDVDQFFVVQDMPKAMEIMDKYFFYEFGDLLEGKVLRKAQLGNGVSITQSFVLAPKPEVDT